MLESTKITHFSIATDKTDWETATKCDIRKIKSNEVNMFDCFQIIKISFEHLYKAVKQEMELITETSDKFRVIY